MNGPVVDHEITNRVKAATNLVELVREQGVTLRKNGHQLIGLCPFHQEQTPSFLVDPEKQLYKCFGCDAAGDVFNFIRAVERVSFPEALAKLTAKAGASLASSKAPLPCTKPRRPDDTSTDDRHRRTALAMRVWRSASDAADTLVQTYLQSRAIKIALPPAIRFGVLTHRSGGTWPTMVALVSTGITDIPIGVHRTFLAPDGCGKASVKPAKMMLGPCGGGAVRLASFVSDLMVGEGIETCLSAMQATGRPAWAALSATGLRRLDLPDQVRRVTLLADGDTPGEAAALDAARRWKSQARRVQIARPPRGLDFNDVLLGRVMNQTEVAA